jgi:hypothetical protein
MEKPNIIMCRPAKSHQLMIANLSLFLGLVALTGPAFAGLARKIQSPTASQLPAAPFDGGQVMPPSATPLGFSLRDMAAKTAQFTTSGNNPQFFPTTPFQILYDDPNTVVVTSSPNCVFVEQASASIQSD